MRVAKLLRIDHGFGGYIHLKAVPGASQELMQQAGAWADRLSANVELAQENDLLRLALQTLWSAPLLLFSFQSNPSFRSNAAAPEDPSGA